MIKRKLIALVLAGTLVFGLTACGSGSSDSSDSSAETSDSSDSSAETSDSSDDSAETSDSSDSETASETETAEEAEETDTGDLQTVRIGLAGEVTDLSDVMGIAVNKGFLEEELEKVGYTADVIGFAQAGQAVNEALVADSLDMAIYGDMPAVTLKSTGTDTTIFAVVDDQRQMGILAQEDAGIESASDLVGKKVIVGIGTVVLTTEDRPDLTAQFFAVGKTDYLEENPEAAKAVVKALLRSREYMIDNREECYEILGEETGLGASVIEKVYAHDEDYNSMYAVLDDDNVTRLESVIDFMLDEEFIDQEVDAESFVDMSYSQEAEKEYEAER